MLVCEPRLSASCQEAKNRWSRFIQDEYVGVKWKWNRGLRISHRLRPATCAPRGCPARHGSEPFLQGSRRDVDREGYRLRPQSSTSARSAAPAGASRPPIATAGHSSESRFGRAGGLALDAKQPADVRERLARSGSVSRAFHQYRRACAQHATSIKVPRLYRWSNTACASATR
jgi:hypothetical protein